MQTNATRSRPLTAVRFTSKLINNPPRAVGRIVVRRLGKVVQFAQIEGLSDGRRGLPQIEVEAVIDRGAGDQLKVHLGTATLLGGNTTQDGNFSPPRRLLLG